MIKYKRKLKVTKFLIKKTTQKEAINKKVALYRKFMVARQLY